LQVTLVDRQTYFAVSSRFLNLYDLQLYCWKVFYLKSFNVSNLVLNFKFQNL
jgi:hypothetical protein